MKSTKQHRVILDGNQVSDAKKFKPTPNRSARRSGSGYDEWIDDVWHPSNMTWIELQLISN